MTKTTRYIPGVCNINPQEIKRRRLSGHFGFAIAVIMLVVIVAFDVTWYLRTIIIVPVFLSAIGYLQAYNKFCVGYAGAKQHHADDGAVVTITDKDSLARDAKKRRKMNLQATIIAAFITAIVCVIPL